MGVCIVADALKMDVREKLVELLENHCAVIGEDNCKASQSGECTPRDCAICLASDLTTQCEIGTLNI